MSYEQISGAAPLLGMVLWAVFKNWRDISYLWRPPIDWNMVREAYGYEAQTDIVDAPEFIGAKQRKLFGVWPLLTDWDKVRREYGYGSTIPGRYRVLR